MSEPANTAKYYCLGALLIFLGSILLCALGFTVVLPHEVTREWIQLPCNVTNVTYEASHCACATQVDDYDPCIDKYPCMQIHVIFDVPANTTANITAGRSRGYLYRFWNDAFHKTCSLYECGDDAWNIKETTRFRKRYGRVGMNHSCWLNPEDPLRLILFRVTTSSMVHALVWPSLSLGSGALIWLGLWVGVCNIDHPEGAVQLKKSRV